MFRDRFEEIFGNFFWVKIGGCWCEVGEFWLEGFHREDAKDAEGIFFTAKTRRAPRFGIARLAGTPTRVFGIRFGEPAAGAAGCWLNVVGGFSPRRREGREVFLSFDLASRLRERPGAGADGRHLFYRKDAKLVVWRWNSHGWWLGLWRFCLKLFPEIAGKVQHWNTNDGDGLDAEDAIALSRLLEEVGTWK